MSRNTIISSFKKLPAGLLVMALLVLIIEGGIYLNRAELTKDYWNKFLLNEHELLKGKTDYRYLIVGDSIQKTGIDPTLIESGILSLGLPGGKPMGLYLLIKRYLKTREAPKAIFLYIDPEPARDSLLVILRYFISIPEFMSIWKDLTWPERRIFLMRYWASLDMRKVGLIKRDEYPYSNKDFVERMVKDRGFMPSPGTNASISDDFFAKNRGRYQNEVTFSANDLKYLNKIMDLAASKNIKVVFLGFVIPKGLYTVLEETGFNKKYNEFFEGLKKVYPQAYFVKEPLQYLPNDHFGDQSHVNKTGAAVYTGYFKNNVYVPFRIIREKELMSK